MRKAILMMLLLATNANAAEIKDENAVKAIIGEAENQGTKGMLAVACGIRNRGSLKGVYGLHNPRVVKHRYSKKIEAQAVDAWVTSEDSEQCLFVDGADHWENINAFGKPEWANTMVVTYKYKDHVFYRKEK